MQHCHSPEGVRSRLFGTDRLSGVCQVVGGGEETGIEVEVEDSSWVTAIVSESHSNLVADQETTGERGIGIVSAFVMQTVNEETALGKEI